MQVDWIEAAAPRRSGRAIFEHESAAVSLGDALELLEGMPSNSIDSCVTDPPYELGFMGKEWDGTGVAFSVEFWRRVLRVLKPGAHLVAFGGTRTYHRMTCAIEDAGFEVRDSLHWFYGTGFPKSLNVGEGRGTALKPGHEPIVLARKPLEGTVAANLATWGTGALNIDACRIGTDDTRSARNTPTPGFNMRAGVVCGSASGRWPANVLLDEGAAAELDSQTEHLRTGGTLKGGEGRERAIVSPLDLGPRSAWVPYGDSGGASRFFYVAKPGRSERDLGCDHLPAMSGGEATDREDGSAGTKTPRAGAGRNGGARNFHPTVKPVELMRHLVRLVTPPSGQVLDPFTGSGSTGVAAVLEGRRFVGFELTEDYAPIIAGRLQAALDGRFGKVG
ncbi:MAG: site-specific DNA-methyltransferase [Myxococcaceae bacterium]|nr:site-specific DNA-methyltransferase [Myxococcaceae bacterium]